MSKKSRLLTHRQRRILRRILRIPIIALIIWATIITVYTLDSLKKPSLSLWHRIHLKNEFKARMDDEITTLDDYMALEDKLFDELDTRVCRVFKQTGDKMNRFDPESLSSPIVFEHNYNKTYILSPDIICGGVLLLHGLSDSPYSLRHIADLFEKEGFYVVSLRVPGHGTVPSSLRYVNVKDWLAAVELAVNDISETIGPDKPLYITGYSNGGALAVLYSMLSIEDDTLRTPDKLFCFSPAIGVTRFAGWASQLELLSFIPLFEKAGWSDISSEYDPFKYNSFPLNAAQQSHRLAKAVDKRLVRLEKKQLLDRMPPIITFQSVVDTTVLVPTTLNFYNRLGVHGHELVLFDINRKSYLESILKSTYDHLLAPLESDVLPYTVTLITNSTPQTLAMSARRKKAGASAYDPPQALGLTWPVMFYSLSHIALTFPLDDPVYGVRPYTSVEVFPVGKLEMRGERNLLRISSDNLLRVRCNPFFSYVQEYIRTSIE